MSKGSSYILDTRAKTSSNYLRFQFYRLHGSRVMQVKAQGLPKVRSLIGDFLLIKLGPQSSLSSE